MTSPPDKETGDKERSDAFDRAFDIEGADASAARLADDDALRAELDAAREAASEEAERPLEESHAEYIDPTTVPPVSRVQAVMHSQKLYVNEAVAFPQKGIPTVRGMRPVLGPPPPEPPAVEDGAPKARSRAGVGVVIGAAAGAIVLVAIAWLLAGDDISRRPSEATEPSAAIQPTAAPPTSTASDASTVASPTVMPPPSAPMPTAEPSPSSSSSASPATSSSAKPGRNPADYGGIQF